MGKGVSPSPFVLSIMPQNKLFRDISLCFLASFGLFWAGSAVPLMSMPTMLLYPAPLFVLSLRTTPRHAASCLAVISAILAIFVGVEIAASYAVAFGIFGILLSILHRKMSVFGDLMIAALALSIALKIVGVIMIMLSTGVNVLSPDLGQIEEILMDLAAGGVMSTSTQTDINALRESVRISVEYASAIIPSMIICFSATEILFSIWISSRIPLQVSENERHEIPPMREWGFPKNIYIVFAVGLILELLGEESGVSYIPLIAANLMTVSRIMFIIQGLAVTAYFIDRRGAPSVLKYISVAAAPFISIWGDLLSILGICDIGFGLRRERGRS